MLNLRFRITFLMVVSILLLQAQDLFVDGAEWHYRLVCFGSPNIGVNRCYIEGDTIIQNRVCLIYMQDHATCNGRPKRNYLYKEDDTIYFFDEDDDSFKVLYNFSLEVGDTMIYETGIHSWDLRRRTHYIRIDSIGKFFANDVELKSFSISYAIGHDEQIFFEKSNDIIIEDIGNTSNFFHFSDGTGFCDDKYSDPLRCFSAPSFPTIKFTDMDCLTVSTTEAKDLSYEITAFPNPFEDELTLELTEPIRNGCVNVLDQWGKIQHQQTWPENELKMILNLGDLPSSTYLIRLRQSHGVKYFGGMRVVKMNK